jgi:tetratricopeptide (TPR) repeat protein
MKLVPAAGHLVHMPGHIFLQTGDYDLAADTNVNAAQADKNLVTRTGATGIYPLMYWTHNIHFIAYARAQQGRYAEARKAAEGMVGNVGSGPDQMQMLEGFLLYPLIVDLRFSKWDVILATPAPAPQHHLHRAFWQFARAMALAGRKKLTDAAAEQGKFEELRRAVPKESRYLINNTAADFLGLAAAVLDAKLASARGEKEKSIQLWRQAVDREATIQYDEPPAWHYPIRESLGAELLMNGQAKEAEAVFRQALDTKPRDGRLLFGLWQCLKAQSRESEAALVEGQFREAWKDAEVTLRIEDF